MGFWGRAFGRAVVYNVVRDGFYQAHQQGHRRGPAVTPQRSCVVTFACEESHEFEVEFPDRYPSAVDLVRQRCPTCGRPCVWLCMDQHIENEG